MGKRGGRPLSSMSHEELLEYARELARKYDNMKHRAKRHEASNKRLKTELRAARDWRKDPERVSAVDAAIASALDSADAVPVLVFAIEDHIAQNELLTAENRRLRDALKRHEALIAHYRGFA